MAQQTVSVQHPAIGTVSGIRRLPQVDQFLGIQYATLADRFSRATLIEAYPNSIDGTALGPLPVADPAGCDNEQLLLQHALPHPTYTFSDTECLTLNVAAPSEQSATPLPVLVFVHGGGFVTGSANWPQWDVAAIVEKSIEAKSPIVAVSINYRLGHFGFLTSAALRDAGYLPNNGLYDQKVAFRWIQKFIHGFGGDPNNVTYLGNSIGAASGFIHLQSGERLFKRLAALGGSPLIRPFPTEVAEFAYGMVTKALGLESLSPAEQVRALLEMPAADLEAKLRNVPAPVCSVVDGDVIRGVTTYDVLSKPQEVDRLFPGIGSVKDVLLGSCQFDGMIFAATALPGRKDDLAATLEQSLRAALKSDADSLVPSILSLYGLDKASVMDTKTKTLAVTGFLHDICFGQGARATAQAWADARDRHGTTTRLMHFDAPNPWPGAYAGYATHALEVAFALQNYNAHLAPGQRACAERLGRDLIAFASGRGPFPPFGGENGGVEMVYTAGVAAETDGSTLLAAAEAGGKGRRAKLVEIVGGKPEMLDKLSDAFGLFLRGPQ